MTMTSKTPEKPGSPQTTAQVDANPKVSKLDLLLATLDELTQVTGWQKHSVRGAIAGTLKRKGHSVSSAKTDGVRRYRLEAKAS
jgi:Protein of unknown function (DUF3489)